MTLLQLKYFIAVAQHLNYTQAAQMLFVSQSSVSKQIVALEEELKVQLFYRDHHAVTITPVGEFLFTEFRHIIDLIDTTVNQAQALCAEILEGLNIGILSFMDLDQIIPSFLNNFYKSNPSYQINIESYSFEQLQEVFQNGIVDIIFVRSFDQIKCRHIQRYPVSRGATYIYYGGNVLPTQTDFSTLTLRDFDGTTVFLLEQGTQTYIGREKYFYKNYGFHPSKIAYIGSWEGILSRIHMGYGVTIAGSSFRIAQDQEIRRLRIEPCRKLSGIDVIYHTRAQNSRVIQFVDALTSFLNS